MKNGDLLKGHIRFDKCINNVKVIFQAEIDSAGELIDFNFNCEDVIEIIEQQPKYSSEEQKFYEYRALEGFIFAVTPFNLLL